MGVGEFIQMLAPAPYSRFYGHATTLGTCRTAAPTKKHTTQILVLADIDVLHWQAGGGEADLLLSCGDLFDQVIVEAAQAYHCPQIFAVKGNHDQNRPFASPIENLHLQVCNYGGLRFGGLNGAWRYKPRGAFLYTQEAVGEMLAGFAAVDVLVTHIAGRHPEPVDRQTGRPRD